MIDQQRQWQPAGAVAQGLMAVRTEYATGAVSRLPDARYDAVGLTGSMGSRLARQLEPLGVQTLYARDTDASLFDY
jgi:hypothetical protein